MLSSKFGSNWFDDQGDILQTRKYADAEADANADASGNTT